MNSKNINNKLTYLTPSIQKRIITTNSISDKKLTDEEFGFAGFCDAEYCFIILI